MATLDRKGKLAKVESIYHHCKASILSEAHLCELHEALRLGAFILQAEEGDFDPEVHTTNFITDLRQYLPSSYAIGLGKSALKSIRKQLLAEYASLQGTNQAQAKLRFARICKQSPTFGIEFTTAHTRATGSTSMVPALVGFSKNLIVVLDYKSKKVIQQHDLTKVIKWQGKPVGLQIDFKNYNPSSVFYATAGDDSSILAKRATAAIHQMLSRKKKSQAKSTPVPEESTDDGPESFRGFDEAKSASDDDSDDDGTRSVSSYKSMGKQSGFLKGVNMTSQRLSVMDSGWFNLQSDAMSTLSRQTTLSRQSSSASGVTLAFSEAGDVNEDRDDWTDFLDDAGEDITASAGVLDSVARLGPKRTNPRWCLKMLKSKRIAVKSKVLGIASICKKLLPIASSLTSASTTNDEQKDQFTKHINVFTKTLPPLAGDIVTLCALATLPGQNELVMVQAGDLWIGILQLVQAVRETSSTELKEAMKTIATASKSLLDLIQTLTEEEKYENERKTAAMLAAVDKSEADRLKAERKATKEAEAAMAEVERIARMAMSRKADEEAKAQAEAANEAKRQEIAQRKAIENAEKFAKAEAKRKAKEEAERVKAEALAQKRKAEAEEAERKKLAKEEADRLAKAEQERKAKLAAEKKAKFHKLLAGFEPTVNVKSAPISKRTSAVLNAMPKEKSKPKYGRDLTSEL